MTEQVRIDPKIAAHVEAALTAGFTVYALPETTLRPVSYVAVCLEEDGPWAHIQKPTMALDPVELDVPVTPNKDWGSGVHVDHDGTPEDAVRALRKACTEEMVTVRFMTRQYIARHGVPTAKNVGRKCISWWKGREVKLGERGTNWIVPQLAGRLEVGDRFEWNRYDGAPLGAVTVADRRYRDDKVIITGLHLNEPIELNQRTFVTLVGAA